MRSKFSIRTGLLEPPFSRYFRPGITKDSGRQDSYHIHSRVERERTNLVSTSQPHMS